MTVYYWIYFFSILIASIFAGRVSQKEQKYFLYFILGFTFFFFAFRIGFTPDYYGYEEWFRREIWYGLDFSNFEMSSEILFSYMASHLPYRIGLILQTILICWALGYSLKNYIPTKYWPFAILLFCIYHYFVLGNFSGYRSSYVTVAFFFAFVLRERFKYGILYGILLIALSGFIHQAGFVMLIPYLVCTYKKYNKFTYVIFFSISVIFIVFMYTKVQELNSLTSLVVEDNFRKFEAYMDEMSGERGLHLTSIVYIYMFFYTASALRLDIKPIEHIFVFQTCFFFTLLIMPAIGMIDRFQYHYMFPAIIGFTVVYDRTPKGIYKYAYLLSWGYLLFRSFYLFAHTSNYTAKWGFYDNILFPL